MKHAIIILLLALAACKSAERLAAERAQRERDLLREIEVRHTSNMQLAFPVTFPGGMVVKTVQAGCPDFDSGAVKSKDGKLSIAAPCPDIKLNLDSLMRSSDAFKSLLAKAELADRISDSISDRNVTIVADRDRLKEGRNTWRKIGITCMLIIAGGVFLKIKGII